VVTCLLSSWRDNEDVVWLTHAGVIRALQWLERQAGFGLWLDTVTNDAAFVQELPRAFLGGLRSEDWPQEAVAYGRFLAWPSRVGLKMQ